MTETDYITLDETDVQTELDEYETYTVTVTILNSYRNPNQGSGNRRLQYEDGTGERRYITLWSNSTPRAVYEFDFMPGERYTLSAMRFTVSDVNGTTYYNITATNDTQVVSTSEKSTPDRSTRPSETSGAGTTSTAETDAHTASDADSSPRSGTGTASTSDLDSGTTTETDRTDAIDDAFSDVPGSTAGTTGHALTTFASTTSLTDVTVHEYTLSATNGYHPDDEVAALNDTYSARYSVYEQVGNPPVLVVPGRLRFASLGRLPAETIELENFTLAHEQTRTLDPADPGDRQTLKTLVEGVLKRALWNEPGYEIHGIDQVLSAEPLVEKQGFRLHERYNLAVSITAAGRVYLSVDFRHKTRSDRTLDQLDSDEVYAGLRVNVTYKDRGKGAWVDAVTEANATDSIPEMGNQSVVEYHRNAGRIPAATVDRIEEANRRVIRVTKMGSHKTEFYPPELLAIQPHFENLTSYAARFNEATRGKTRLSAQRCINRSTDFVERLAPVTLDGATLAFSPTPLAGDATYELARLFETDAAILQFGDGVTGDHPKRIRHHEVYAAPDAFRVCLIHPNKGPGRERWNALKRHLASIGAAPDAVDEYNYDIDTSADKIYGDLLVKLPDEHEYAAACVLLPPAGFGMGASSASDIYHEVKKALRQKRIDSQMAHLDTLNDDFALPNVALGLIAAAGGIPFTTENAMPGDADLFIGIDVSHRYPKDSDDRVHIAASTTSIYSDGTILGYTSARPQAGEKLPPVELKNIVRQAIVGYKKEVGEYPNHIVLHRDGFMNEDLAPVRELLESFNITYDVVEVRKQSPARLLNLGEGEGVAGIPDKGVAAVNREAGHAILATFGNPEALATSGNTGLPQPIQVERTHGTTDIETLTTQVYLLSQSHVGAVNATARLPITTDYADKASGAAAEGYLPETSKLRQNLGFL